MHVLKKKSYAQAQVAPLEICYLDPQKYQARSRKSSSTASFGFRLMFLFNGTKTFCKET